MTKVEVLIYVSIEWFQEILIPLWWYLYDIISKNLPMFTIPCQHIEISHSWLKNVNISMGVSLWHCSLGMVNDNSEVDEKRVETWSSWKQIWNIKVLAASFLWAIWILCFEKKEKLWSEDIYKDKVLSKQPVSWVPDRIGHMANIRWQKCCVLKSHW